MARCPKCEAEIDNLATKETRTYQYTIELIGTCSLSQSPWEDVTDDRNQPPLEYTCPECGEIIAIGDDEAVKVLGGGTGTNPIILPGVRSEFWTLGKEGP